MVQVDITVPVEVEVKGPRLSWATVKVAHEVEISGAGTRTV